MFPNSSDYGQCVHQEPDIAVYIRTLEKRRSHDTASIRHSSALSNHALHLKSTPQSRARMLEFRTQEYSCSVTLVFVTALSFQPAYRRTKSSTVYDFPV